MLDRLREARKVRNAYREFFRTPSGQIVLKDLLRTSMMFSDTGVLPDADLRQIEGGRNLVRRAIKLASYTDDQLEALVRQPVVTNQGENQ